MKKPIPMKNIPMHKRETDTIMSKSMNVSIFISLGSFISIFILQLFSTKIQGFFAISKSFP